MPTSVIVADGTPLGCETLSRELRRGRNHFQIPACAVSSPELLRRIDEHRPDVAVISAGLQDGPLAGYEALRSLRSSGSSTRAIILLDCCDNRQVLSAFAGGARGVFCRSDTFRALAKCIRCVAAGQIWANNGQLQVVMEALADHAPRPIVDVKGNSLLTRREEEVVSMAAKGLTNNEISTRLTVSAHTVKNHLFHVYEKLGISSRMELILYTFSNRYRSESSQSEA